MATTKIRLPRNAFLETVQKSGLLAPDDLIAVLSQYDPDKIAAADPIQVATFLVRKKLLTKFQAMHLLHGRTQGFVLGKYRLLDGIRQDRVGMVFKAEAAETKELVSVKVLPTERVSDNTVFRAFTDEVRTAARVEHPNVARILDLSSYHGTHFVVSEHIPAPTLDKVIAEQGPLDPNTAAQVVAQVAIGLLHAHRQNVLHRDIKPGNIALLPDGRVKLIDLGLTHMLENPWQKATQRMNLKEYADEIAHIAPEQAWGCELDGRSDVYSLGSTFYTLLTGRVAFPGLATQAMTDRQTRDLPPPSQVRPGVPQELDELVTRMGAKDPQKRFASAVEVVTAMQAWLPLADWNALGLVVKPKPAPARKAAPVEPKPRGFFGGLLAKLFGR
ncbi:serine/threonine protein kinase [Frigoriglobus tundricola]|uniref:Serine/threonine protein kinase PrkC, regulator of stationary phase n=1 Tax=Frigoriglobus tundricola TaxID=2774151 RepID=A0A6M5YFT2_9BACT|nr:serine/threonine-protein kinase [Frigoriglobus tundricola]QJW92877.1 Serine/threonine protein kinase PrkC, regulator of stationary phase [Frigoriglobus tundricola]